MIYIVIPSFNEKIYLSNIIDCLNVQTYKDFKIVISDNGSKDGTIEMIEKNQEITLIKNDESFFWTKSTNQGINYVLNQSRSKDDYVLTLNCDSQFNSNYLENMIAAASENKNSLICSVNVDYASKLILFGGLKINYFSARYNKINNNERYNNELRSFKFHSDFLPGRGTLVPIETYRQIGNYDEKLPQYFADYEFSSRAKKNLLELIVIYDTPIYFYSQNTGLNNENKSLSSIDFLYSFFSKKSPLNLYYRLIFNFKVVPKKYFFSYMFFDLIRVILGSLSRQLFKKK